MRALPQRKEHFFSRLRGKGSVAARMLRRAAAPSRSLSYHAVEQSPLSNSTASDVFDPCELELEDILKTPKLGKIIRSYVEEHGATGDLELLSNFSDAFGNSMNEESDLGDEIAQLSSRKHGKLLRLSQNCLRNSKLNVPPPSEADSEDATIMRQAYDVASRRMMAELLPRFCESDQFKEWMVQQQLDERREVQVIATIQDPLSLSLMKEHVAGSPNEHVLTAAVNIEQFLLTSTADSPRIELAEQLVAAHFASAARCPVLLDNPSEACNAVNDWVKSNSSEAVQDEVIAVLQAVLIDELYPRLHAPLLEFCASPCFIEHQRKMKQVQEGRLGLLHWLHIPEGLKILRRWMADQRAVENIDFIAEAMSFKGNRDIASLKDAANRIYAKYIVDGALAQVCLPTTVVSKLSEGMQPRFPSASIFDDAINHVLAHVRQDMWVAFTESADFAGHSSVVTSALQLVPSMLIAVRVVGCAMRHAIPIMARIVTIGSARDCDIIIKENGQVRTTVVQITPTNGGAEVTLLWNERRMQHNGRSGIARSSTASSSVSSFKSNMAVMTHNNVPRVVQFGEAFTVGEYEAVIMEAM